MPKKCRDSDPPLGGDLYARGTYSEGGTYMLVYTVADVIEAGEGGEQVLNLIRDVSL
jgi:hypothetical protein